MKKTGIIVLVLAVIFGVGFWAGTSYSKLHRAIPKSVVTMAKPLPPPSLADLQDYRATREKTLRDNPDLAAEYRDLLTRIDQQQQVVEAAMLKADLALKPTVTKLAAARERSLKQTLDSIH